LNMCLIAPSWRAHPHIPANQRVCD
jgi:hypothetical protein